MTITESVRKQIELGKQGLNQGLTTGLEKLDKLTGGLIRERYLVITSNPGGGKTAIYLYSYVFKPLRESLENYVGYFFSMDMSAEQVVARLMSMYIFEEFGKELSSNQIYSTDKGYILEGRDYEYVQKALEWFESVESHFTIYDKPVSSGGIYKLIMEDLQKYGHFEESDNRKVFIPNNPNLLYVIGLDHWSLLSRGNGRTIKEEIDLGSTYLKTIRNYGACIVTLQQSNRSQGTMERRQQGMSNFTLNDLKDSANPSQDCDIVLAVYNPNKDRLNTYRGYDIKKLGGRFRSITTLKQRYGEVDQEFATNFFGKCNIFAQMSLPNEIYDYNKYLTPDYLIKKEDNEDKVDSSDKRQINFIL